MDIITLHHLSPCFMDGEKPLPQLDRYQLMDYIKHEFMRFSLIILDAPLFSFALKSDSTVFSLKHNIKIFDNCNFLFLGMKKLLDLYDEQKQEASSDFTLKTSPVSSEDYQTSLDSYGQNKMIHSVFKNKIFRVILAVGLIFFAAYSLLASAKHVQNLRSWKAAVYGCGMPLFAVCQNLSDIEKTFSEILSLKARISGRENAMDRIVDSPEESQNRSKNIGFDKAKMTLQRIVVVSYVLTALFNISMILMVGARLEFISKRFLSIGFANCKFVFGLSSVTLNLGALFYQAYGWPKEEKSRVE
ncbi:MAG: hypothetical protein ACOVOR_03805 [Rhabdochlamydiaceae bacterium]